MDNSKYVNANALQSQLVILGVIAIYVCSSNTIIIFIKVSIHKLVSASLNITRLTSSSRVIPCDTLLQIYVLHYLQAVSGL